MTYMYSVPTGIAIVHKAGPKGIRGTWGKGAKRQGSKYYARQETTNGRTRYFYTKQEYDAYKNVGKVRNQGEKVKTKLKGSSGTKAHVRKFPIGYDDETKLNNTSNHQATTSINGPGRLDGQNLEATKTPVTWQQITQPIVNAYNAVNEFGEQVAKPAIRDIRGNARELYDNAKDTVVKVVSPVQSPEYTPQPLPQISSVTPKTDPALAAAPLKEETKNSVGNFLTGLFNSVADFCVKAWEKTKVFVSEYINSGIYFLYRYPETLGYMFKGTEFGDKMRAFGLAGEERANARVFDSKANYARKYGTVEEADTYTRLAQNSRKKAQDYETNYKGLSSDANWIWEKSNTNNPQSSDKVPESNVEKASQVDTSTDKQRANQLFGYISFLQNTINWNKSKGLDTSALEAKLDEYAQEYQKLVPNQNPSRILNSTLGIAKA